MKLNFKTPDGAPCFVVVPDELVKEIGLLKAALDDAEPPAEFEIFYNCSRDTMNQVIGRLAEQHGIDPLLLWEHKGEEPLVLLKHALLLASYLDIPSVESSLIKDIAWEFSKVSVVHYPGLRKTFGVEGPFKCPYEEWVDEAEVDSD
jgi:hypothetical protein